MVHNVGMAHTLTNRPKSHFGMRPDCSRCDAETLKRPVYLTDAAGHGAYAYGTHCAAVTLGLIEPSASQEIARKALTVAVREHEAAEAAEANRRRNAESQRWERFLADTGHVPGLAAMAAYKEWTE